MNDRYRSNTRNIEYEKLEEDICIIEGLIEETSSFQARVALMKLLGLIERLKQDV